MRKIAFILLLSTIQLAAFAQDTLNIDLDIDGLDCKEVIIPEYRPIDYEFPLWHGFVDLEVEWLYTPDSLVEQKVNFGTHQYQVGDLLFLDQLKGKAFDLAEQKVIHYGEGKFKELFDEKDLVLQPGKRIRGKYHEALISLNSGDTIYLLEGVSGYLGKDLIFNDSIIWMSGYYDIYAYSLNQRKKEWSKSTRELLRNEFFQLGHGNDYGGEFTYKYRNRRIDSTYQLNYYVDTNTWTERVVKTNNEEFELLYLDDSIMYFDGSDRIRVAVNIATGKAVSCEKGYWRRSSIVHGTEHIFLNHTLDEVTGEVAPTGNKYRFDGLHSEWGDYILQEPMKVMREQITST